MERVQRIEKSKVKDKKYSAILNTGRKVDFGYAPMGQYKDSTGLGIYSHKNHLDKTRRRRYLQRHHGGETSKTNALADEIRRSHGRITARWLATEFLW